MLKRLSISNYALIDSLDIHFTDGLTIITGETGAGKSIILGALSLLLGDRANVKFIRDPQLKTVVEATFDIDGYRLEQFFEQNDLDFDNHECIIRRELTAAGRSRSFVNDSPVPLNVLRELSTYLVDIHSQHSNMLLSSADYQLSIVDHLARDGELLTAYRKVYTQFKDARLRLDRLRQQQLDLRKEEDYIRFQLNQFHELNLQAGEAQELESLQLRLSHASELKAQLWEVCSVLDGEEQSVLSRLDEVKQLLQQTQANMEETQGMAQRVDSSIIELKDIARTVSALQDDLSCDPQELEQIESRLNAIYALERKHNVSSGDELLAIQADYESQLSKIDNSDEQVQQMQAQVDDLQGKAHEIAEQLSQQRRTAAWTFSNQLKTAARPLGLKNLEFEVRFTEHPLTDTGIDEVQFMMAFNKNQSLLPVKDTASGGEISRVMLCVKSIIAKTMKLPTIIFDEVDSGVSGDVASMIGEMMNDIAASIQVIAITHLPQVAAHADCHLRVFKTDTESETITHVEQLDHEHHVLEVARMLSGRELNQAAIENARHLIDN